MPTWYYTKLHHTRVQQQKGDQSPNVTKGTPPVGARDNQEGQCSGSMVVPSADTRRYPLEVPYARRVQLMA